MSLLFSINCANLNILTAVWILKESLLGKFKIFHLFIEEEKL
jgi:hypothetical protein